MPFEHTIVHRDGYSLAVLTGAPSLPQFIAFIQRMAVETRSWPRPCGLFDLRGISTLRSVTDHAAIGAAVAQDLRHLRRIASLVPPDRTTGISRKVAQGAGVSLSVFVEEEAAIQWLLEPDA